MQDGHPNVFDTRVLTGASGGDPHFERQMLEQLVDIGIVLVGTMRAAVSRGDAGEAVWAATNLKAPSVSLGAVSLSNACTALEQAAAGTFEMGGAMEGVEQSFRETTAFVIRHCGAARAR